MPEATIEDGLLWQDPLPDPRVLRPELSAAAAHALLAGASRPLEGRLPDATALRDGLVDGPVAGPSELGAWVERLCGPDLAVFRGGPSVGPQTLGTRSLLTGTQGTRRGKPRRSALAALAVLGLAAAAGGVGVWGGGLWWRGRQPFLAPLALADTPRGLPAPRTPAEPAAPPPTASIARPPPRPRARPSEPRVGYLTVDSKPWALVSENGRPLDSTPISKYPLPVGTHTLVLTNPDLGRVLRREVAIVEGEIVTVRVEF